MPCEQPRNVHRPTSGGPISFNGPKLDGRSYIPMQLPCSTCLLCREEQARQQAVRIYHESLLHNESAFLTLTYNDKNLPPHSGLQYADLFKFWKRVKQQLIRKHSIKLRYYAVGEYGDKTLRPHYHACIFGHAFVHDRMILRTTPHLLWTSPILEQAWGLGNVSVGALNFRTARYTASYVTKKLRSKQQYVRTDEQTGELIKLEQPRSFMSRNLGKDWWIQNYNYVTAHDHVVIDGRRQKPPRCYDKWLQQRNEIPHQMLKEERKERSEKSNAALTRARANDARARAQQQVKTL